MIYYKDKNGEVFAYETEQERNEWGSSDLVEMTQSEIDAHLNPPRTITADSLKEEITALRWQIETGGITLPSGVRVATGIDDQNRITSVIANARLANLDTVSFKAVGGWVTLTLAELEGVAAAIAAHVQACFTAERTHHEAIDALAALHAEDPEALQQALEAYDIEQGWPTTDLHEPQPA
ncbi:DUF4376 domain-containing protein [Comamonas aquatica]|uniref:DUF4376 domain-containing protein n=1 Tax=Comamonas aquatica TaxID=225991 RepID=A0AA42HTQ1_9BURK|nr:DUF4376 domain-containing protein [Comamonas aquatica]MDH0362781.1 DUF4376 domain-containing protein [Comamonas aquatica]